MISTSIQVKGVFPISGNVDMNYYFAPETNENVVEAEDTKPEVITGVTAEKVLTYSRMAWFLGSKR